MATPTIPVLNHRTDKLLARIAELELSVTTLQALAGNTYTLGETTLASGGTKAVVDYAITASSFIMLSRHLLSGTPGVLSYVLTPGVGFTINSSSTADLSSVAYQVFH